MQRNQRADKGGSCARVTVALNALCRFASDNDRLEGLRYDSRLVSDETLRSDGWTVASPRLPCMSPLLHLHHR
ncbi:MAG: hypothetical protein KAV82_06010 [Phycisphaerae bacterium]|nr:hypothetical protein [Phycisphaerae bacterium]